MQKLFLIVCIFLLPGFLNAAVQLTGHSYVHRPSGQTHWVFHLASYKRGLFFGSCGLASRSLQWEYYIEAKGAGPNYASSDLEVKDSDGRVTRWGAEWGGVTLLTETGVSRQTLKAGDKVVITGPPSRDPLEHKVLMEKIRRASDGWTWGYRPNEVLPAHSLQTAK